MNRLNLAWWCWISLGIERLLTIKAGDPYPEAATKLQQDIQWRIWYSYQEDAALQLRVSGSAARELLDLLGALSADANRTEPITEQEARQLTDAATKFKVVYEEELAQVVVYAVTPKGIYATEKLVDHGNEAVSRTVAPALSKEAVDDLRAAGRCLAFALWTAAGFHIARATESVIRTLMELAGCPAPADSQRNWGRYIGLLEGAGVDPQITHHLRQVKDLHRNPLIHPEHNLGESDAMGLLAICTSLVERMGQDIIRRHGARMSKLIEERAAESETLSGMSSMEGNPSGATGTTAAPETNEAMATTAEAEVEGPLESEGDDSWQPKEE